MLNPFVKRAQAIFERLPTTAPADLLSDAQMPMFEAALELRNQPEKLREAAINAFIEAELLEMKDFFDT